MIHPMAAQAGTRAFLRNGSLREIDAAAVVWDVREEKARLAR
jgi:hypothetical protein